MNKKKGIQLSQAFGAVLTIVLVAILIIIAIYMFSALQTTFPSSTVTIINESGFINSSGYTNSSYLSICNFVAPTSLTAYNRSSGAVIPATNYTLNSTTMTITSATAVTYSNTSFTFNYGWGGSGCDATVEVIDQFTTYPALIGLVGTIVFLALVIGVLVASFAFGGKGV